MIFDVNQASLKTWLGRCGGVFGGRAPYYVGWDNARQPNFLASPVCRQAKIDRSLRFHPEGSEESHY